MTTRSFECSSHDLTVLTHSCPAESEDLVAQRVRLVDEEHAAEGALARV